MPAWTIPFYMLDSVQGANSHDFAVYFISTPIIENYRKKIKLLK